MAKYYSSEMSMRVSNNSIAVLGGSGYMKDYACERHLRDSRITTIYEGTTQLQIIAAVAGVLSGTARTVLDELLENDFPGEIAEMIDQVKDGLGLLEESIEFVKTQPGTDYRNLYARKLVDMAIYLIVAALFCDQAKVNEAKKSAAKYWLSWRIPEIHMLKEQICSGDDAVVNEFEILAGPVPVVE